MKICINEKYKEFVKLLEFSNGKYRATEVFKDFVLMFAISIQNGFCYSQEYEDLYLQTIKKYEKSEHQYFFKLVEELVKLYSKRDEINDILGEIYSQIGAISKQNQQFFTPNHIAKAMAKIAIGDLKDINKKDYISINDPACGSGVLLLGVANELDSKKINYKRKALFVAQDIDLICVCMTYIQMFFYNMAGIVIQGNSLIDEQIRVFYTPEFIMKKWYEKIKEGKVEDGKEQENSN